MDSIRGLKLPLFLGEINLLVTPNALGTHRKMIRLS